MKKFLIILFVLQMSGASWAAEEDPLWEKYIDAKIAFQEELAELLSASNPSFKDLIRVSRDLQIAMAKMRRLKYYHLLENDPGRITRDRGTSRWANFDWTDGDEKMLLEAGPAYAEWSKKAAALEKKNQENPDWPAARKAFAETMKSERYQAIQKELMDAMSEIDGRLKGTE